MPPTNHSTQSAEEIVSHQPQRLIEPHPHVMDLAHVHVGWSMQPPVFGAEAPAFVLPRVSGTSASGIRRIPEKL